MASLRRLSAIDGVRQNPSTCRALVCGGDALKRDAQLVEHEGNWQGVLTFPWCCGVVLTRITRRQSESAGLGSAIEARLVICLDEMLDDAEL